MKARLLIALLCILQVAAGGADKPKKETIQAEAMGQVTAGGKTFNVIIKINSYSTRADQKALIDAYAKGGHNALVNTLRKMKSKGRVGITGTVGYQIAYIRKFLTKSGRMVRLITDRPIQFSETDTNLHTEDYDLSAIELNIAREQQKSDGKLIVAGKFLVDKKQQQIGFESFGDAWRLTNVMEHE